MEELPKELKARKTDFSPWYNQVIQLAKIIDKRYNVKGTFVWLPYGYSMMQAIKKKWDYLFQSHGIQEVYFPLLVPEEYAKMNDSWFEGFKDEAFWVNAGETKYILRPTGEPAMYPMYSLWIKSYTDLPLRLYETVSSFRYETKHTRPLIRDREITVWYEIHTAHATKEEADKEAKLHESLVDEIWKYIAVHPIKVRKPEWETFPGAVGAIEYYTIMPDGRAMENGSINMLGTAYAKKFNIKYMDKEGNEQYAWQVCTGNGARYLVSVFAVHGDDKGLFIPPNIAPIQAVIVPIIYKGKEQEVMEAARQIYSLLKEQGIKVYLDDRDKSAGKKFYDWEIKGVPFRIEIGPRDVQNNTVVLVRRDGKKESIGIDELKEYLTNALNELQKQMYEKSKEFLSKYLDTAQTLEELKEKLREKKVVKVHWCGKKECWDSFKGIEEGVELFGDDLKQEQGKCIVCGEESRRVGYVGRTY